MEDQDFASLLAERCKSLNLEQLAHESLGRLLSRDENNCEEVLCGYERSEIQPFFDRFEYHVCRRNLVPVIRVKIRLAVKDSTIGYYELETSFDGNFLDDFLVIEKQKYIKDISLVSYFQSMDIVLPLEYLRRNHIQYEYVAYISLIGTLFISKQFQSAGRCIQRA